MKQRILAVLLALVAALALVPAVSGSASAAAPVQVTVDGRAVAFSSDLGYPYVDNSSRTMVPFRAVANFMPGVRVEWSNDLREAIFLMDEAPVESLNGKPGYVSVSFNFPIGANYFWEFAQVGAADGSWTDSFIRYWPMDTAAVVKGGRTYAPIRYLAEAFNYTVGWSNSTKTVTITNPHQQYWGAYFLQAEQARGTTRVTSDSVAKRYAQEVIRMTRNDNKVSYQGKAAKNGQSVWMFRYDYTYRGSSYYDEFYVTPGGNIYYRTGGSGSYTKWW